MFAFYLAVLDDENLETDFTEIYNKYERNVFNYIFSIVKNRYDAMEVSQDTWASIAENFSDINIKNKVKISNYIYKTAKNKTIDLLRKKETLPIPVGNVSAVVYPDDFFDYLEDDEKCKKLIKVILSLPDSYRDVLSLYYLNELKPGKIAKITGIPLLTVKNRLEKGKRYLKKVIEEVDAGEYQRC